MKATRIPKVTSKQISFALFDTDMGKCGIAWSSRGIVKVQLPEKNVTSLRARLSDSGSKEISVDEEFVQRAIKRLRQHLAGQPQDFSEIPLDLSAIPEFHQKVYKALRKLPVGRVTTYGDLAEMAGSPRAARAVGQAMSKNPVPILIPCHRVLGAAGKIGGFSAFGGLETKITLLDLEHHQDSKASSKPEKAVSASKGVATRK